MQKNSVPEFYFRAHDFNRQITIVYIRGAESLDLVRTNKIAFGGARLIVVAAGSTSKMPGAVESQSSHHSSLPSVPSMVSKQYAQYPQ